MRVCLPILASCTALSGCAQLQSVDIDLTSTPVRFIIDHVGWPRPFGWPRVTEFAIASNQTEAGELVWYLKSVSEKGEFAHRLAFIYGRVSPGFYQVFPEEGRSAKPLEPGRIYYIAAGGDEVVYRMAFSLPVDSRALTPRSAGPPRAGGS